LKKTISFIKTKINGVLVKNLPVNPVFRVKAGGSKI
jgi:hypothetical protein